MMACATMLVAEPSRISDMMRRLVSSGNPSSSQKTEVPANSGTALAIFIMASVWLTMEGIAGFLNPLIQLIPRFHQNGILDQIPWLRVSADAFFLNLPNLPIGKSADSADY